MGSQVGFSGPICDTKFFFDFLFFAKKQLGWVEIDLGKAVLEKNNKFLSLKKFPIFQFFGDLFGAIKIPVVRPLPPANSMSK